MSEHQHVDEQMAVVEQEKKKDDSDTIMTIGEATDTEMAILHASQISDVILGMMDRLESAYIRMYADSVSRTHQIVEDCIAKGNNTGASIAVVAMIQTINTAVNLRDYELTKAFQTIDDRLASVLDCVSSIQRSAIQDNSLGISPSAQIEPQWQNQRTDSDRMASLLGPMGLATQGPRGGTRFSAVIHESLGKMVDSLPASQRTLLDTVITQSAFCPSIMALHGVHHPLATIYSTRLDTSWDPLRTMVFANPSFLGQTLIAETCRYQGAHIDDGNDAPLQHLLTVVHLMAKMGFGPQDIEYLAPIFDQTFSRRVQSSAEGLQYLHTGIVKVHCYPGVFRELIRRFFDAQQLGRGILAQFRKDRGTRDEVGTVLAWMRNYERQLIMSQMPSAPSGRVTLLWGLQQKIDSAATDSRSWFPVTAPTPWHRIAMVEAAFRQALRELESRDSDRGHEGQLLVDLIDADSSPVWMVRAYPIVLRMHMLTHIKESVWNLKFLPPTPEMFLHTGILELEQDGEADSVTSSLRRWFDTNPWRQQGGPTNHSIQFRTILEERGVDVSYAAYIRDAQKEAEQHELARRSTKRRSHHVAPHIAQAAAALAFVRGYAEYSEVSFASYVEDCITVGQVQDQDSDDLERRVRQFGDILQSVAAKGDDSLFDEARRHHKNFTAFEDLSMLQTTAAMWGLQRRLSNTQPTTTNQTPGTVKLTPPSSLSDAMAQSAVALDDALTNAHMDPADGVVGTASYRPCSLFPNNKKM